LPKPPARPPAASSGHRHPQACFLACPALPQFIPNRTDNLALSTGVFGNALYWVSPDEGAPSLNPKP
jgi:hypothetical protein